MRIKTQELQDAVGPAMLGEAIAQMAREQEGDANITITSNINIAI